MGYGHQRIGRDPIEKRQSDEKRAEGGTRETCHLIFLRREFNGTWINSNMPSHRLFQEGLQKPFEIVKSVSSDAM
jgi:hypothetical protein